MLISIDFNKFLSGNRDFDVLFQPEKRSSLVSVSMTRNFLLINKQTNVNGELFRCFQKGQKWISEKVNVPDFGRISVISADDLSDQYFFSYENFIEPQSLYFVSDGGDKIQKVKSLPHFFNNKNLEV